MSRFFVRRIAAVLLISAVVVVASRASGASPRVARGAMGSTHANQFVGTIFQWYNDPQCPFNPDSHLILHANGYQTQNGPVIVSVDTAGMTGYYCGGVFKYGNWDAPEPWLSFDGSDPYWGYTTFFPYAWVPNDCWGGGQPC